MNFLDCKAPFSTIFFGAPFSCVSSAMSALLGLSFGGQVRGEVHDLRDVSHRKPESSPQAGGVDGDPVHPRLELVRRRGRVLPELREQRVVLDQDVQTLLLAREQGRVERAEVVPRLLGLLDRVQDETVLQLDGVLRVALATLEEVLPGLRKDPEVRDAGAGVQLALRTDVAVVQGHPPADANRRIRATPADQT